MATKDEYISLLDDPTVKGRVVGFPKGHCWSSATGFLELPDGRGIFVKDRDMPESIAQQTMSLAQKEFCKPFDGIDYVGPTSYSIERPDLEELKEGGPGHLLWKLKEEKWKKDDAAVDALRERKVGEEKKAEEEDSDDDEASVEDEKKPAPSEFDCWQLEEAATYCLSFADELDASAESVDQSLRRKLRLAAERTGTRCLDLSRALMMTKYAQDLIRDDPEWKAYKCVLLENADHALTREETHLLMNEKLAGDEFQVAMMFAAAMALPDSNTENLSIQEISDDSSWRLRVLHFDTGILPVSAGVSLESLHQILEDSSGHDYVGEASCNGYYYPCLLSLPAVDKPLSAAALAGLQKVDTNALKTILEAHLSDDNVFEKGLGELGEIVKQRVEMMKKYAAENPSKSLKKILFHTIAAWKRDWDEYDEESEYAEWIWDTLEWANKKK